MKNNKLIAEFMDLRSTGMSIYKESEYKYHSSWDWLMPVVSKIARDEKYFENEFSERLFDIVPFGCVEDVYEVVVEFIKIYNDEEKEKSS